MTSSQPPDSPGLEDRAITPQRRGISLRVLWERLSLSNIQIILVILVVIGGRLAIDFSARIIEGQQKIGDEAKLEATIRTLQRDQQQLEQDKAYYGSAAYIEVWAHSDGKMVQPGEKIVIPLYNGKPRPKQPALPAAAAQPIPKWATWWSLFFDSPPPTSQAGAPSGSQ